MDDGESLIFAAAAGGLVRDLVEVGAVDDGVLAGDSVRDDTLPADAHALTAAVSDLAALASGGLLGDGLEASSDFLACSRVGGAEEVFEVAGVTVQGGFGGFGGEGSGALHSLVDNLLLLSGAGVSVEGSTAGNGGGRAGLSDGDGDFVGFVGQDTRDPGAAGVGEWEGAGSGNAVFASLKVEGFGDVKLSVGGFTVGKRLEVLLGKSKNVKAALETLEGERLALLDGQFALVAG